MAAAQELSMVLEKPAFLRDRDLKGQLNRASIRVASDIAEGFEEKTDRNFARYLYDSKGGTSEIRAQLKLAVKRKCITEFDKRRLCAIYVEIARMLSGLIGHLLEDDWKQR